MKRKTIKNISEYLKKMDKDKYELNWNRDRNVNKIKRDGKRKISMGKERTLFTGKV